MTCFTLPVVASGDDCGLSGNVFDNAAASHPVGLSLFGILNEEMATRWVSTVDFDLSELIGSTIDSVTISLKAAFTQSGLVTAHLHFEDADDPQAIADSIDFNDRRTNVTIGVDWEYPDTTAGQWYDSPNLAASLQAVVDRPGFAGNAINLFHHWHGGGSNRRSWLTFDSSPSDAPEIEICYTDEQSTASSSSSTSSLSSSSASSVSSSSTSLILPTIHQRRKRYLRLGYRAPVWGS